MQNNQLERGLSFTQATAINMIDMVGTGPFVTIPLIVSAMKGPQCILAWVLGAVLAFMDGTVWSELGAKWPQAGGSYVFLQKLYGEKKWGRLMSFLFIWQTMIQAPLVIASGAIGFSQYLHYLMPLNDLEKRLVSGGMIILLVLLLYRNIKSIGNISVFLWIVTGGTLFWLIGSGIPAFNPHMAFSYSKDAFDLTPLFFAGLGHASISTVYSYLGYYNICQLGAEIKKPEINIPKSIFISIAGIAVFYLAMQIVLLGNLPWQDLAKSEFVVSIYFEHLYSVTAAKIATALVLIISFASIFSAMLGYSRVPYAAAKDGNFFPALAKVHPTKKFPHISLLCLGAIAFIFSLLFKMKEVITAIITMRILVQFVGQAVGVIAWHYRKPKEPRPFKMPLFPAPAIISIIVWLFILLSVVFSPQWPFVVAALAIIGLGIIVFYAVGDRFQKMKPVETAGDRLEL